MCYAVSTRGNPEENDGVDECAVPRFGETPSYDIPSCPAELQAVVDEYRQLFSTVPGFTDLAHHTIPTANVTTLQSVFIRVAYQPSTERK